MFSFNSPVNQISMPPSQSDGNSVLETIGSLVVLGANGSGKTRLGVWIENHMSQSRSVHRISAQKSLSFPDNINIYRADMALARLISGLDLRGQAPEYRQNMLDNPQLLERNKLSNRWQGNPATSLLNDFEALLETLFAQHNEVVVDYWDKSSASSVRLEQTITKLDRTKYVWQQVLPHRKLIIRSGEIKVHPTDRVESQYSASSLSDGERVIFYLAGQCLVAPDNSIIIIDEPEIHMNRTLQARFWDTIEAQRPDCLFMYLTHDVEFATSRVGARKIWIKSYDGNSWDWRDVPQDENIPEEAMLQIVGSRKPILFVEGDKGSLDYFLFSQMYEKYTIIPCGTCDLVISATASFRSQFGLHHMECKGIVDRDFRSNDDIARLSDVGVYTLDMREIENLFLCEEVLKAMTQRFVQSSLIEDSVVAVQKVQEFVINEFSTHSEQIISRMVAMRLEKTFKTFSNKPRNKVALEKSVDDFKSSLNVSVLYAEIENQVNTVVHQKDYHGALRLYDNKGLLSQCSKFLGIQGSDAFNVFKRAITSPNDESVLPALRMYAPNIEQ